MSTLSACIFAGPTLPPRDAARAFEGIWLPPAKHGDVYRATSLLRPRVIAIVDGYFQWVPSVRHQEILWAIDQGVHVFGASSMGALRAAELTAFGMRGVGRIYEAYRTGRLDDSGDAPFEDDDEVAVVHGPAEVGYLVASEAMVNIRCTLAAAECAGIIAAATRARLVSIAKAVHFPERSYEGLLERARAADIDAEQLDALQEWLPGGRVNQKHDDAVAMLETVRSFLADEPSAARPGFAFEHTTLWKRGFAAGHGGAHDTEEAGVLAELRLRSDAWQTLRWETLQACAAATADSAGAPLALAQRLGEHRDDPCEIERILREAERAAAVQRIGEDIPPLLVERQMLTRLRATGGYENLSTRAQEKRACLAGRTDLPHVDDFSGLQLLQLRDWFFSQSPGAAMPDDLKSYLHDSGYTDETSFHEAIFAEYVYQQMADSAEARRNGTLRSA